MGILIAMRRQRGVVCVEMALLLPLFLLLVIGLLEYGWLFTKAHQITNVARNAARIAVLPDSTVADVETLVTNQMAQVGMAGKYTLAIAPANISALMSGQTLQVTITSAYSGITLCNCPLIPVPARLRSAVTMAKEGP